MTCGLARDLLSTAMQEPNSVPEKPTNSKPLAIPVWREPMSKEGAPSGEMDRESEGRVIDWGPPRVQAKFGSLERLVEWSSPSEGSEEE